MAILLVSSVLAEIRSPSDPIRVMFAAMIVV
jgi:ABC-type uncharacterized transport system ATPase subunit